jgi:hypothetical protein
MEGCMATDSPLVIKSDCSCPANRTLAIFLVSVWGLFLEMLLIRWIGTEIRIFAYLQNTVLVVCFLGLGLGCLTSHKPVILRKTLLPLLVLVLLMAIPPARKVLGSISEMLSILGDVSIWTSSYTPDRWHTALYATEGLALTFCIMACSLTCSCP